MSVDRLGEQGRSGPAATVIADPRFARSIVPAPAGVLARAPSPVLILTSLSLLVLVGAALVWRPLPAALGICLWALFASRRAIGRRLRAVAAPRASAIPASEDDPAAPAPVSSRSALIGPDLAMVGRLSGAARVDLFGRLSGEVRCDALHVHAGAELRGLSRHRRIAVDAGAVFEGVSTPEALAAAPSRRASGW